jgi:hypothetical protein
LVPTGVELSTASNLDFLSDVSPTLLAIIENLVASRHNSEDVDEIHELLCRVLTLIMCGSTCTGKGKHRLLLSGCLDEVNKVRGDVRFAIHVVHE